MNNTKSTYLVLLLVVPFLSACHCTPDLSLNHMVESDNSLYINTSRSASTRGSDIRTFDLEKEKWGKIKQRMSTILKDSDGRIIVIDRGSVLRLNKEKNFSPVFDLPMSTKLITADKDFFYLLENKAPKDPEEAGNKGLRYSKKDSRFLKNHFDHNGNLIVSDVCEDNNFYWFICHDVALQIEYMQKKKRGYYTRPYGPLVIVSKSKEDGSIKEYQFDDQIWSQAQCLNGTEFIWVYARFHKKFRGNFEKKHLIKFSKKSKTSVLKSKERFNSRVALFPNQYITDEEPYIWAFDEKSQSVVKVDTKTMESKSISLALPHKFKIRQGEALGWDTDVVYEFLYSNKKFLWLSAKKNIRYGIYFIPVKAPYLVRVSKNNMRCDLIKMSPTVRETVGLFSSRYILETVTTPLVWLLLVIGRPA